MKKVYLNAIKIIISIILLTFVIVKVGLEEIIGTFLSMDLKYIPLILVIYFISVILGAFNIYLLLKKINVKLNFLIILKYHLLSWSVGLFMPGKIGEFSIIYLLRKEGIHYGKGFAIAFLDKFITLFTLLLFSFIGFIVFFGIDYGFYILLAILTLILLAFILTSSFGSKIIKFIFRKYSSYFEVFRDTFKEFFIKHKMNLFINFLITILKWFLASIVVLFIFFSFGYSANIFLITLISMSLIIINLVPITFHGLGLKELAAVYLYGLIGIPGEISVATYLIFTIIAYLLGVILMLSFGHFFFKKTSL